MIEITVYNGTRALLNPSSISTITEASASSQWHGIKCIIKIQDGCYIETMNTYEEIQRMLANDPAT